MPTILGHATLHAGADLNRCPWMQYALQEFRLQQPTAPPQESAKTQEPKPDVFHFLDTVKDRSMPHLPHVQYWTDNHCTNWCSGFANWCLEQAGYNGPKDALALSWLNWGQHSIPRWGAIAVVTYPNHSNHVAFYIMEKGGYRYLLGGNQSDRDHQRKFRSVNIDRFSGKCRIEYRMPANGNWDSR